MTTVAIARVSTIGDTVKEARRLILTMSLLPALLGAAPPAKPTTKVGATTATSATTRTVVTRRAQSDAAAAAVRAAVVALTKEHQGFLRNAGTGPREASTYFIDHPDDAVTTEAIVAALQSRGGGDPRTAAYVKWQLLSALPDLDSTAGGEPMDAALAKQLLTAYRHAPQPIPRPGIAPQDKQKLDVYVQGKKQADETDVRADFDSAVSQVARQNVVILRYRDDLYKKLPKTPETFAAGMDDLMQRLQVVAEDKAMLKQLIADVRQWAALEPRPPQVMSAIARAARKLADTKGPQYYQSPYWSSANVFAWRKRRGSVDSASALKDLAVYLEEQAALPQLELREPK